MGLNFGTGSLADKNLYLGDLPITSIFYDNNLLWPLASATDADAWIAQVEADGGSLTVTEKNAVVALENDLKATSGLYEDLINIYPLVGGDEASCKYNLKGAADAFTNTIGFSGSWAYDADGVTGDGSTTYANTNISPADIAAIGTGISLHVYLTVNVQSPSSYDMGSSEQSVIAGFQNTTLYGNFGGGYVTSTGQVSGVGDLYSSQHTNNASGTTSVWKNGTSVASATKSRNIGVTNTFYLGNDNRGSNVEYGNKGYGFAAQGLYLDSTKMSGLNTAVQTYNTTLSR